MKPLSRDQTRARALRAQAIALRAQADALDLEAEALEEQPATPASSAPEWLPVLSCGYPATTVRGLVKRGTLRGKKVGRASYVHAADLAAWLASDARPSVSAVAPVVPIALDPYERALAKRAS